MGLLDNSDEELIKEDIRKYRPAILAISGISVAILVDILFESRQVTRSVIVTAFLFAFHDYFGYVFRSLYQRILKKKRLKNLPLIGSSVTMSVVLGLTEILIATPLAASSQYQVELINELSTSIFIICTIIFLFALAVYVISELFGRLNKYLKGNWDIVLVISLLGINHLQLNPLNQVSGIDIFPMVIALIITIFTIFILIYLLAVLIYAIIILLAFLLPFTVPFSLSLPTFLEWWGFLSLILVYTLFIIYHYQNITALTQSITEHFVSTDEQNDVH